jgi:hypothetical protein
MTLAGYPGDVVMTTRALHAGTALLLLAACSPGGDAAPDTVPSGPAVDVSFAVEGGIAGIQERLEVAKDGTLALFRNGQPAGQGRLESELLDRLHGLVATPAFRGLAPQYLPKDTCCDRFQYTVRVRRSDGAQAVTTIDDVTWPRALADVIALLQRARAQLAGPPQERP